jgi:hypothetical protein
MMELRSILRGGLRIRVRQLAEGRTVGGRIAGLRRANMPVRPTMRGHRITRRGRSMRRRNTRLRRVRVVREVLGRQSMRSLRSMPLLNPNMRRGRKRLTTTIIGRRRLLLRMKASILGSQTRGRRLGARDGAAGNARQRR